jgi:opacity protein-like surface antigen
MKRIALLSALLVAFVVIAPAVHAEADIGLKKVGGRIGLVDAENIDSSIGFEVFGDLGTIIPQLHLETFVGFWSKSQSELGIEAKFRDIMLGAHAKYEFELDNPKFTPYAGGGLSIHIFKSEVDLPTVSAGGFTFGGGTASDSSTKIGLDLLGGIAYAFSEKVDGVAELAYMIVSDVGQLHVKVGIAYDITK